MTSTTRNILIGLALGVAMGQLVVFDVEMASHWRKNWDCHGHKKTDLCFGLARHLWLNGGRIHDSGNLVSG